jgi:hypothetical protein
MTYTKKQFLEDVAKEARALRHKATKRELDELDFSLLDPKDEQMCIYGQMTGDCKSKRAAELILSCCKRFVDMPKEDFEQLPISSFTALRPQINGSKIEGVKTAKDFQKTRKDFVSHFSAIEAYILLPNAKNKNLIAFLKGERKDLVL